jgi:hypothetical protein
MVGGGTDENRILTTPTNFKLLTRLDYASLYGHCTKASYLISSIQNDDSCTSSTVKNEKIRNVEIVTSLF